MSEPVSPAWMTNIDLADAGARVVRCGREPLDDRVDGPLQEEERAGPERGHDEQPDEASPRAATLGPAGFGVVPAALEGSPLRAAQTTRLVVVELTGPRLRFVLPWQRTVRLVLQRRGACVIELQGEWGRVVRGSKWRGAMLVGGPLRAPRCSAGHWRQPAARPATAASRCRGPGRRYLPTVSGPLADLIAVGYCAWAAGGEYECSAACSCSCCCARRAALRCSASRASRRVIGGRSDPPGGEPGGRWVTGGTTLRLS